MIKLKDLITEMVGNIILVGVMKNVNGGLPNTFRVTLSNKEPIHLSIKKNKKVHLPVKQIAKHRPHIHSPKWIAHNEKEEAEGTMIIPTRNKNGVLKYKDKRLYYEKADGNVFIVKLEDSSMERLAKKARVDLKDPAITSQQFYPPDDDDDEYLHKRVRNAQP